MLTIVISAAVALGLFGAGFAAFDWLSGLVLGLAGGIAAFILLMRRGRKRLETSMKEIETHMKAQRFEKTIAALEAMRPTARWQPGLGGSIDAQIGMVKYAHMREFEAARPYLERSHGKVWQAWAMLAAGHFKKERYDEMKKAFEHAVRRNKKEAMLWLSYAYCEWKRGGRAEAIEVLSRAQTACPADERIKAQLLGLQNGKKLKMPSNDPEWLALHLERTVATGQSAKPRFMPPAHRIGVRHR
jgi:tetratricopeptide (TPR) repeat protein